MEANRTPSQFHAIENQVIMLSPNLHAPRQCVSVLCAAYNGRERTYLEGLALKQIKIFMDGRGKGMVHWVKTIRFGGSKQRKINNPKKMITGSVIKGNTWPKESIKNALNRQRTKGSHPFHLLTFV